MKRILYILFTVALLASCCPCRKTHRQMVKQPVTGVEWQLIRWDGSDIDPDKGSYTLRFTDDGRLSGLAVCNTYTATWRRDSPMKMQIGRIASTLRGCPTDEQPYLRMLDEVTGYRFDGDLLLLLTDSGVRAVYQSTSTDTQ